MSVTNTFQEPMILRGDDAKFLFASLLNSTLKKLLGSSPQK